MKEENDTAEEIIPAQKKRSSVIGRNVSRRHIRELSIKLQTESVRYMSNMIDGSSNSVLVRITNQLPTDFEAVQSSYITQWKVLVEASLVDEIQQPEERP